MDNQIKIPFYYRSNMRRLCDNHKLDDYLAHLV
ncbi:MAG: hypothetical protein ACI9MF_001195, partial [Gammaproteobacteria bacterium]